MNEFRSGGAGSLLTHQTFDDAAFWAGVSVSLTPEQRAAITHVDGPLLVVAGPGSGKTTVITYRVAYLTQVAGISPSALLVVTFTKAAADSMKARTAQVAGPAVASRATFGTFHSLAFRILRAVDPGRRLQVMDEDQQLQTIRQLMRQAGLNTDEDGVTDALTEISRMRATTVSIKSFKPRSIAKTEFVQIWEGYQEAKAQRGLIDFDDLLHECLALLKDRKDVLEAYRRRFTHLLVDEVQDTNLVQWEIVQLLAAPRQNLCVVGDDDQAIYGWRGASPEFLLAFPQQYPGAQRVTLDLNHRCPPPVVAAANRLAAYNTKRFGKVVRSAKPEGPAVELMAATDSLHEAEAIVQRIRQSGRPLADWAVIYRINQQAHALAQVLAREGVPYRALGGLPNLYKRWPVQDLLAYLRAATGESQALEQVINRPNRYISRAVLNEAKAIMERRGLDLITAIDRTNLLRSWQMRPLEDLADHLRRIGMMNAQDAIEYTRTVIGYDEYIREYCAREGGSSDDLLGLLSEVQRTSPPLPLLQFLAHVETFSATGRHGAAPGEDAVTLVTCHKAKGLEFPCVVVAGAVDKLMPHRSTDDPEEERRLMYVALTRAIDQLIISIPATYEGREVQPSPFVAEALGEVPLPQAEPAQAPAPAVAAAPADPLALQPGTPVLHEEFGKGFVESADPEMGSVIVDFGGRRISLDRMGFQGAAPAVRVLKRG